MKLHELTSIKKRVQRIGRGGKRGTTAGRGTKGQKSRAGRRLRPAERDLILRIPKKRGFRNKPKREKAVIFNLETLSKHLKSLASGKSQIEVTIPVLKAAHLLPNSFKGTVKVLGVGEMAFPVAMKGISVSTSAKQKIEKAGGKIEV